MDWQRITEAVSRAATLDFEAREAFLSDLSTQSPETFEAVRNLVQQKSDLDAFMMTAVGDYLPLEDPIYKTGDVVGLWKIESLIGSGGMGDVYKANRADSLYEQTIALKVMKGTDKKRRARFDAERKRLAVLSHPGIAMIVDGGQSKEGHPYLAMQYVDGIPIKAYFDAQTSKQNQILGLFLQACDAVTSAHNNLILHRDIKSDNILVTENGQVKLVDFGIATLLGEEDGEDVAPFSLGNAAPEQLNGETVSVQTDVFALGVLLHHLLTDRLPTRQPDGCVKAKLDNISADLRAIIEKSLQTDPQSRYESVSALSQDVRAVLNHETVTAFRGSPAYRFKKLIRRAPLASALSAGLAASLLIGMGVSQHFARTAQDEALRANEELATAQWRTDQSKLRERISNAKSQMMIYAFGQEDVDSLSEHLITLQNRNIAEQKEKNPLHTAATSYAIGRHFVSRNDYKKAVSVLEPWVTEGYGGDAQLLSYGQVNLGHTYLALGEPEKALDMFKKSVTFYAGTPDEFSMDHAATAMEIALLSKDQETIDESLETINTTLSQQENPYAKMYLLSKLYNMEYDRGNWDGAYKSIRESVDLIDSNSTLMTQGSDTRRLKLAHMEIFHHKNLDAAQEQIDLARDVNQDLIGENLVTAKIHQYQGSMHWIKGNNDLAVSEFETSLPLVDKYEGKTDSYPKMLARLAIFYSDAGQADKASGTLEEAKALSAENRSHWIPLAETYLLARSGNLKGAQDYYNNTSAKSYWENHLEAAVFLEALQKKGLQL